jgi:hypothetical protein
VADKVVNKRPFEVEVDGTTVKLAVRRPDNKVAQEATLVYNRAFREAAERGLMLRARLDRVMRDQNLWDDEKQAELVRVSKVLATTGRSDWPAAASSCPRRGRSCWTCGRPART